MASRSSGSRSVVATRPAGPWIAIATDIMVNVSREGGEAPPGFAYGIITRNS